MVNTLKQQLKELDLNKEIDIHFMIPLNKLLLQLKLVEKNKEKTIKTPYIKAEILIPHELGTQIKDVLKSDWRLALFGVKYKQKNKK